MAFYYRGLNDTFYEVVKLTEENNASIDVMRLFVLLWRSFPLRQLDNKKKDETEKERKIYYVLPRTSKKKDCRERREREKLSSTMNKRRNQRERDITERKRGRDIKERKRAFYFPGDLGSRQKMETFFASRKSRWNFFLAHKPLELKSNAKSFRTVKLSSSLFVRFSGREGPDGTAAVLWRGGHAGGGFQWEGQQASIGEVKHKLGFSSSFK